MKLTPIIFVVVLLGGVLVGWMLKSTHITADDLARGLKKIEHTTSEDVLLRIEDRVHGYKIGCEAGSSYVIWCWRGDSLLWRDSLQSMYSGRLLDSLFEIAEAR